MCPGAQAARNKTANRLFSLPERKGQSGNGPQEYLWRRFMQRSLSIDPEKCTGCLQCELACSLDNEGMFNPSKSRIRVFKFESEGRFVPYTCTQCAEAWCLKACPVDAISLDAATGAKVVSEALCVGCKVCTIACPFGTINYNQDTGKVIKCDLCEGEPECAKACPTDAITYIDANWTGLDRMRAWAQRTDAGARAGE
jgi:Fe-S-cluster-containing hydrogenase component 2